MRRLLVCSSVLALMFVASWLKVLPVHCDVCGGVAFRTSITSLVFGYDTVVHECCLDGYAENRWTKPADPRPRNIPLPGELGVEETPSPG